MTLSFEFTGEEKTTPDGARVGRIRAVRDIASARIEAGRHIRAGDLGGWVEISDADASRLREDAWVGEEACVSGAAIVRGSAHIRGHAVVHGTRGQDRSKILIVQGRAIVRDHAIITGRAQVYEDAIIEGYAQVGDNAHVYERALVSGHARITGGPYIFENARVLGHIEICDRVLVAGNAQLGGTARVWGDRHMLGTYFPIHVLGTHQHTVRPRRGFLTPTGEITPVNIPNKDRWGLVGPTSSPTDPAMARFTASVSSPFSGPWANWCVRFTGMNGRINDRSWRTTDRSGRASLDVAWDSDDFWAGRVLDMAAEMSPTGVDPDPTYAHAGFPPHYAASVTFRAQGANAYALGVSEDGLVVRPSADPARDVAQLATVFTSPIVDVAAGAGSVYALLADGTVWSAGANEKGQLGDGTTTSRNEWAPIPGLTDATQIAASQENAFVLVKDGTMRGWGANQHQEVGDGTKKMRTSPVVVRYPTKATQIAAGRNAHYAVFRGEVFAWGSNLHGELGGPVGPTAFALGPVALVGGPVVQVAAGTGAYAVRRDGTVVGWGENTHAELAWTPGPVPR